MIPCERFLFQVEKDNRSSVIEYINADRIRKSKEVFIYEKITTFRIGAFHVDKLISILQVILQKTVGLFHYNLVELFNFYEPMM